jgi:hypothetical protein
MSHVLRGLPEESSEIISSEVDSSDRSHSAPFSVGEKLVFSVEYGFVTAGEATMSITGIDTIQGHPAYRLQTRAQTNEIFSAIYKINDMVESHLDVDEFYSRQFKKKLREGSYRKDLEIFFDQDKMQARYAEGDTLPTLPRTQDVLSAFFFLRTQDFKVGTSFSFPCHDNKKNYPLEVKVLRKEKIVVPAGKFECFVVEPKMKTGGLTRKEAKMFIWVTADEKKMPVLMETRMKIGSIAAKLTDYTLGEGETGTCDP